MSIHIPNRQTEKVTISLVREYLLRKGYFKTLSCLTEEASSMVDVYTSRRLLGKDLRLETIMKINKRSKNPLRSMLEVFIKKILQEKANEKIILKTVSTYVNNVSDAIVAVPTKHNVETNTSSHRLVVCSECQYHSIELSENNKKAKCQNASIDNSNSVETKQEPKVKFAESLVLLPEPVAVAVQQLLTTKAEQSFTTTKVPEHQQTQLQLLPETEAHGRGHGHGDEHATKNEIPSLTYNGNQIELSLENVSRIKQEKSPSRVYSLRNSLSEDFGSEPEEGNDGQFPAPGSSDPTFQNLHSKIASPSKQVPSNLFAMTGRINSLAGTPITPIENGAAASTSNILESKQNLLAEVTLSAEENVLRQLVEAKCKGSYDLVGDLPMMLKDIEDDEDVVNLSPVSRAVPVGNESATQQQLNRQSPLLHNHKSDQQQTKPLDLIVKTLDSRTWFSLKTSIFGSKGTLLEGWIGQGFSFNPKVPFGLAQKKGGPCGVLAVVQSLILKNLLFGSEYYDDDEVADQQRPSSNPRIMNLDDPAAITNISSKRIIALVAGIVEILWKCAKDAQPTQVAVCLTGSFNMTAPAPELYIFSSIDELKKYVRYNVHRFDCISLVYSAVLTRGLDRVQDDMDFPNSPLLGQHGYCTQELVNLLTIGKAISNAFDNEVVLGDKILKGISSKVDIGFLSLFEHYDSCQVGFYLKNPKYPLWIVCSESHFSVLFSNDHNLSIAENDASRLFNLYYYDGLARQEQLVKLTIETGKFVNQPTKPTFNNNHFSGKDEDSAPPLEKCIRTKWKSASINWNDTEPIL